MAYDYGLVGGIGQGLQQGLLTYMKAKQLNRENQIQNLTAGVETDENGNLKLNQQEQQKRQAQGLLNEDVINARNVDSPDSQAAFTAYKQSLLGAHPERADDINAMEPMSAHQVKDYASTFAKPDIAGGYGLQKQMSADEMKKAIAEALNASHEKITDKTVAGGITKAKITSQGQQGRLGLMRDRLEYQQGKEARSTGNNDPMLKIYMPRLEGAAKIGELINSARQGKVVSNAALLGQLNAEIARLETGSQSPGLGQSEKTELLDKKAQFQSLVDSFTGNPQDAVDPRILDASDKMIRELAGSYKTAIDGRFNFLNGGSNPTQQGILNQKKEALHQTYGPRLGGWEEPQSHGGLVGSSQDPKITDYAKQNGLDYQHAQEILLKRGYKPNGQ